jgi:CRP-like cAMP-binding protein
MGSSLTWAGTLQRGFAIPHSDPDIAALQRAATKVRLQRNVTIFNEGDNADHLYKVTSGVVRLCKYMSDGRRQVCGFRMPGEFFGLTDVQLHECSAEAVTNVVLASYRQEQFQAMSETMPVLRRQMRSVLSSQVLEMQEQIVLLGQQTAMERIASFLLALARRTGSEHDDVVDIPMSRQDIADFLGLTIETVCRAFTDLKRNHTIEALTAHQFRLRNLAALNALTAI